MNECLSTFIPLFAFLAISYFLNKTQKMVDYQPRGRFAKTLMNKMNADHYLDTLDKSTWYSVSLDNITDKDIADKFIQLEADEETLQFVQDSEDKSDWIFTQLWYNLAKSVMQWMYSQTDINGMLNRGSMFVFSKNQFTTMLKVPDDWKSDCLLDLGAGDGKPTQVMETFFEKIYVTEMSPPMRKLLRGRGFEVMEIDKWQKKDAYDVISCLNLLDRCEEPLTILNDVHEALKSSGRLVVALVLPFRPYVESRQDHKPTQQMDIVGANLETQVQAAVVAIEAVGFKLESWARVPYLCEGDLSRPIYHLNDALMVFSKVKKVCLDES